MKHLKHYLLLKTIQPKESSAVPQFHWKSYFLSKKTFLFFTPFNFCYFQWFCGTAYENSNNNIQIVNQQIHFISPLVAVPQRFHSGSTASSVEPLSHFGSKVLPLR